MVLVKENDQDPPKVKISTIPAKQTSDIYIATLNTRSLRTPEKRTELETALDPYIGTFWV